MKEKIKSFWEDNKLTIVTVGGCIIVSLTWYLGYCEGLDTMNRLATGSAKAIIDAKTIDEKDQLLKMYYGIK